jgi:SAM-dependent methyltransferase
LSEINTFLESVSAIFYKQEYENYWSREDRWGTDSYTNVEQVLVPLISCCGRGRVLDIGCGMGRLVKALLKAGFDAKGVDVSERVIAANREIYRNRFFGGSALALPFENNSFDTVVSTDCLEHISSDDLPHAISEIARVATRSVYLTVSTALDRDQRWHLTVRPREWWEERFFNYGFRRHPLMQEAVPFVALEEEQWQIPLVFEKDPKGCVEPPDIDWGRKSGRYADAYMAFYSLCAKFVRAGNRVLDIGCGTGFGSAIVSALCKEAYITGIDSNVESIAYACEHYGALYNNLKFTDHKKENFAEDGKFDVILLRYQPNMVDEETLSKTVQRAADALIDGGTLLLEVSSDVTSGKSYESVRCAAQIQVEDLLYAQAGELIPRHLFCMNWKQRRTIREIKLPLCGISANAESHIIAFAKEKAYSAGVCSSRRDKVIILGHHQCGTHYSEFIARSPFPVEFVPRFKVDWEPPADAGLVMSLEVYDEPGVSALRRAVEKEIPTLILADGIIEYRNTWQHPQNVPGAIMQPVLGHKIACIGDSQARILSSWGNYGKCEIVGIPRLDRLRQMNRPAAHIDRYLRVLIATAKTPYFTSAQQLAVMNGLRDLRKFFAKDAHSPAPEFEVIWRISEDLATDLGLGDADRRAQQEDIAEAMLNVDALITTPSTLMIEGMMMGIPVCVLDYGNSPHYFKTAWQITAPSHIEPTLQAIKNPTAAERLFQEYALHDMCACSTPATPRLVQLVEQMIQCGRRSHEEGRPLQFPNKIIFGETSEIALPENSFELAKLYPSVEQSRESQLAALKYEVTHLRRIVGSKESDLNRFEHALHDFDAELKDKHKSVSEFEANLLAYKDELNRIDAELCGWRYLPKFLTWFISTQAGQRPVYCWGAGESGRQMLKLLEDSGTNVAAFIDSDPAKQGALLGKPVYVPAKLWELKSDRRPFIVITSIHLKEIAGELEAEGFKIDIDYVFPTAVINKF